MGRKKKKKKKRNKKHELLVIQIDYVFSLCEGGKKLDNCRLNKIIEVLVHRGGRRDALVNQTPSMRSTLQHRPGTTVYTHTRHLSVCACAGSSRDVRDEIICALSSSRGADPALSSLWQRRRFSPEATFYVSSLTARWPSIWVVSVQKGVCAEKLLRDPEIMKVPLKQKHQEKPSSSLTAHTRPPVSVSVYLWTLILSLTVPTPAFFFFFSCFSVCSFITVHATALKHLHVQYTLILALHF